MFASEKWLLLQDASSRKGMCVPAGAEPQRRGDRRRTSSCLTTSVVQWRHAARSSFSNPGTVVDCRAGKRTRFCKRTGCACLQAENKRCASPIYQPLCVTCTGRPGIGTCRRRSQCIRTGDAKRRSIGRQHKWRRCRWAVSFLREFLWSMLTNSPKCLCPAAACVPVVSHCTSHLCLFGSESGTLEHSLSDTWNTAKRCIINRSRRASGGSPEAGLWSG